ncbi:hypothetical protein NDR87_33855 [Nocardia sp. CDC159]|uniref:Uncharacterized protein n=1 Tax=Nocardia pulmonis TaxID=2951408 RepID=A0A9X2ECQ3_9NOCA|nr:MULTISPECIES: hypothetical protein [Nocardia]MCM6778482.1 hypothetical protein [Nocardia pulmonis]MCM6791371.1 hypothetical protein [Nocardia sp. CDC159]
MMIAYRDTLRPLDPCGYLDDAVIHRIGTPNYFGVDREFSQCSVSFKSPDIGPGSTITATMLPGQAQRSESAITTRTWDDNKAKPDHCSADAPVGDRWHISFTVHSGDPCATARDIATAALTHRLDPPLRATSKYAHMNSPLAALDPCAVLGTIGQGHRPALKEDGNELPWGCRFQLDGHDDSTYQDIEYQFVRDSAHMDIESVRNRDSGAEETMIGGLRAVQRKGAGGPDSHCQISVSTALQPPSDAVFTPEHLGSMFDDHLKSEIITIDAFNGCAAARATAEELVRLYHQLPR